MFMNVKCLDNRPYFDLELLKKANRPIDELYQFVIYNNNNLTKYYKKNTAFNQFNDITKQLVLDFKLSAKSHIENLINNTSKYGILYSLAKVTKFNTLYIDYTTFPLIDQRDHDTIMNEIKNIANKFYAENTYLYNITCLELIYFFSVIVNPSYNWITMDYLSNSNKTHQYVISTDTYSTECKI